MECKEPCKYCGPTVLTFLTPLTYHEARAKIAHSRGTRPERVMGCYTSEISQVLTDHQVNHNRSKYYDRLVRLRDFISPQANFVALVKAPKGHHLLYCKGVMIYDNNYPEGIYAPHHFCFHRKVKEILRLAPLQTQTHKCTSVGVVEQQTEIPNLD